MGGMIILFMAIMLTISQRMHKTVINSLKLQFENIDLITHLTDAKEHVENLNEKLKSEIRGHTQAEEALKHRLLVLSQPLGAASNLKLTDIIDIDILQKLQDGFAESYDVASLIVTKEGKPITRPSNFSNFCKIIRATEKGAKKCEISDANLFRLVADGSSAVAPCSNFEEILDGAVPILIRNKIVATWAIGQKVISELHEDNVQRYAKIIGADTDQLVSAAKKLKLGSKKRFRSAVSFLELMANNISLLGLQNIQQAREISERKRTEEALRQSGEQLRQAQKMEAVGTLAGGIAHDFNNLLQGVMGYTQMLLMDKETGDPDVDKLTQIENSVQRAGELTRQLLTFSRKVESELRPVNINQEIKQVEKLLKRTIPRMIDIELHLEKNIKVVNADPAQVSQALMNFGLNARDAMPDGGKIVVETENVIFDKEYCKTHLGAVPGEYVLLSFSDTGCGMDKETVEHIFEPFYTTKETGKGTGLGLAMVYGIVKSHDGHIMCYSEPGKGTTFKIYFPAIDSAVSSGLSVERKEEMPGGNETILLVDDEEAILDVARNMLERFGYTAITAESGEKAIEIYKAQKERIDLVILDLGMPGIGGHKCLKELLKIDSRIKVIIASGYLKIEKVKETVESGASGFIGKPYQLSGMLKKVREVLGD
jgi:signal transduction histidine kinase